KRKRAEEPAEKDQWPRSVPEPRAVKAAAHDESIAERQVFLARVLSGDLDLATEDRELAGRRGCWMQAVGFRDQVALETGSAQPRLRSRRSSSPFRCSFAASLSTSETSGVASLATRTSTSGLGSCERSASRVVLVCEGRSRASTTAAMRGLVRVIPRDPRT